MNSPIPANHIITQRAKAYEEPLNVLVIEQDAATASRLLEAIESSAAYRASRARSLLMARESLAEEHFPIVILDVAVGDGDALNFCYELRAAQTLGYVFIVVLMDDATGEPLLDALRQGADAVLARSINQAELLARLDAASRPLRNERSLRMALHAREHTAAQAETPSEDARTHFLRDIETNLQQALQHRRGLSILVIDIDFFKDVNDRHGHAAGDELLRQLANRVRFALPHDQDWIARIGGEEFVAVLPGSGIRKAVPIGERLCEVVRATPFHVAGIDVEITISIGVGSLDTLAEEDGIGAQALLDQADRYLYRSKLSGRDRTSAPPYEMPETQSDDAPAE